MIFQKKINIPLPAVTILLIDGECILCNGFAKYVIKKDKKAVFRFASLQSDFGKEILKTLDVPATFDSVVLLHQKKAYAYSSAVLLSFKLLGGITKSLYYAGIIFPVSIRDALYKAVAKKRFIIGKHKTSCLLPDVSLRERMIE